jgi:hypothetical protein
MTHRVSLAASLVLACALPAACDASRPGKTEFVEVCVQKMGGAAQERCTCYVDSILAEVSPDQFFATAEAVVDNRRFTGLIPEQVRRDPAVNTAIATATNSCLA